MITVYSLLKESGIKFNHDEVVRIADAVKMAYQMYHDREPEQVKQKEGKRKFLVNCYPEEFRPRMEKIILRHYEKKMGQPHKKYTIQDTINLANEA